MEKLNKLIEKCKCGVYIRINSHRDDYETVEQYFKDNPLMEEVLEEIEPSIYEKMKELDTTVSIQCYPETPIGFIELYHYNIEKAIDEMLLTLED